MTFLGADTSVGTSPSSEQGCTGGGFPTNQPIRGFVALVTDVFGLGDVFIEANHNYVDCHNGNKGLLQDPLHGAPEKHLIDDFHNGEPTQLPEKPTNEVVPPSL
jgi:hypothetical protein